MPWTDSDTLLDKLRGTNVVGSISFYAFPIIVNLTSIPVLSIFQRYNLLKEKVCSRPMANFLAVILPWLIAIPLYNGAGYQNLANWGGVPHHLRRQLPRAHRRLHRSRAQKQPGTSRDASEDAL